MTVPRVVRMAVYPVAGHDSMELNLSGAHAPYFTRNLLVLEDSAGRIGAGEVPGGEKITQTLTRQRGAGRRLPGAGLPRDPAAGLVHVRGPGCRRSRSADVRPAHHHPRGHRDRDGPARPAGSAPRPAGRRAAGPRRSAARHGQDARLPVLPRGPHPDRPGLPVRPRGARRLAPAAGRGGAQPGEDRRPGRGRPAAVRLPGLQAEGRRARQRRGGPGGHRTEAAVPRGADHPGPQRRLVPGRGDRGGRRSAGRAHLRRGSVRRRGRLLRPGDPGRVPAGHRHADGDEHDRHRLAAAGSRPRAAQRGHPAGRPALLDPAGLGPGVPGVRRSRSRLGLALQQPLRRLAGDVHPRGRGRGRRRTPRSTRTGSGRRAPTG